MRRKITFLIIGGFIGSLLGEAAYFSQIFFPHMWKNKEESPISSFIFLGFIAGCMFAYLLLRDKENKK